MTAFTTNPASALPALNINTLILILLSGAAGTLAFDIFGQALSPIAGFASLSPTGLSRSLLGTFGLPNTEPYGHLMHLLFVGALAYPIGWLFIARPVLARVLPGLGWFTASAIYGFGLWIFAIGGITSLAGLPFFLNFTGITWVALIGHVIYGIVAGATVVYIERLQAR